MASPLPDWLNNGQWPFAKPVEPMNYDLLIGTQLRFFPLTQLFTPDPASTTDVLPVPVPDQQPPAMVMVAGIRWQLADVTADAVVYHANFAGARVGNKTLMGEPFVTVSFHLPRLLAAGGGEVPPLPASTTSGEWFTAADHLLSPELSLLARTRLFAALCAGMHRARAACYARYFRDVPPRLLESAATGGRRVFLQKNARFLPYSYLCLGEMLPDRPWPRQPTFPVDDMEEGPDFIYYLSPHAYLQLGLCKHLNTIYEEQEPIFRTDDELTVQHLPMDWQEVANTLHLNVNDITEAAVDVTFSVRNAHFVITYEASVNVYQPAHFILPINLNIDNSYTISLFRECYHEMYLEAGQLRVRELPSLKQERVSKTADHPEINNLQNALDGKVHDLFLFFGKFLLPLGLDLALGGGLFGGAVLFALCETLTNQLDAFYQDIQGQRLRAETASLHTLQIAFEQLLPFNVGQNLLLSRFSLQNGLVVSGHFRHATRRYLLRGDCLLPGETLLGEGSTCLVFQQDGNLVLYSVRNHDQQGCYALWCSHGNQGGDTIGRGGDKVHFVQTGNLVMYKGNEVLWQTQMGGLEGNFMCVCAGHIRIAVLSPYQQSLIAGNEPDYAALFPPDCYDLNYGDVR